MVDAGGGGPSWNGTIQVVPGNLEASSSGFDAAGNGVMDILASTMLDAVPEGVGITDPGAAAAWSRMTKIWTQDLENLSNTYSSMSLALVTSGQSYQHTDATAVPFNVQGTSITPA